MARILVTQRLVDGSLDELRTSAHRLDERDEPTPMPRAELLERVTDAEVLVCLLNDQIDDEVLAAGHSLKVVANVAVGHDNIDLAAAARRGIAVVNTPGVLDSSTADIAIALMLAARRRTGQAEARLRQGDWEGFSIDGSLSLDLSGSALGLVGYGRIARQVAQRARGFDMTVRHHTRRDSTEPGWTASLEELAAGSDVLSIHVPLTPETRGLVDARILSFLRPTAVVVNTARGAILDEEALCDALEKGRLWGAGLDVFDGEPSINPRLLSAPNAVLLPHMGSATIATRRAMCELALAGALAVLDGQRPENLVSPR
jgi:glyoxylate reductase